LMIFLLIERLSEASSIVSGDPFSFPSGCFQPFQRQMMRLQRQE
jgi:hypothetical protein